GYEDVSFEGIQKLSEKIITGAEEIIKSNCPLVVVVENDIGKALGNSIISRLRGYKKVICIDGIVTLNGDYMDIGRTVADGQAVPVIVKTLIFNW
uniref:ethanolamine ammonia-lyase reactivating factor EutA n=1 Tax=uncultured Clostridium sp. TaxID=59620 RepID=UPI0025DA411C